MNYKNLEKDICYVIKEEQIKLGYRSEVIRLYYQLNSLNRLLGIECDEKEMHGVLEQFNKFVQDRLGRISITNRGERFCFCFLQQASEYVHANTPKSGFLYDLVEVVSKHTTTIEDLFQVFFNYSLKVHVEKINNQEFDYLVYFEDGEPDDSYYCFAKEGMHFIYHRFAKEDYSEIFHE